MQTLELKLPPPLVWLIFAALAVALAWWLPQANWPFAGHRVLAVALAAAGVASGVAGLLAFRRAGTTIDPHHPERTRAVVSTGIYRVTRNPMYLGLALCLLAVVMWWASVPALGALAGFVAYLTRFQIRPEERLLQAHFGADYEAYRRRVRRWI